jgi:hypothetical protein
MAVKMSSMQHPHSRPYFSQKGQSHMKPNPVFKSVFIHHQHHPSFPPRAFSDHQLSRIVIVEYDPSAECRFQERAAYYQSALPISITWSSQHGYLFKGAWRQNQIPFWICGA